MIKYTNKKGRKKETNKKGELVLFLFQVKFYYLIDKVNIRGFLTTGRWFKSINQPRNR